MWYAIINGEASKPQKAKKDAVALIEKSEGSAKYSGRDGEAYTYNKCTHYVVNDLKQVQTYQKKIKGKSRNLDIVEREIEESVPQMPFEDELKQLIDRVKENNNSDVSSVLSGQWAKGMAEGRFEIASAIQKIMGKHGI